MESLAQALVSKIVTLRSNPHYRMADVIYRKGFRYLDSTQKVLELSEFDGTILKTYLQTVDDVERPDLALLSLLVDRAIEAKKYDVSRREEIVIHIRAGDVIEHEWFLAGDISEQIRSYPRATRCALVICFAFQEFIERGWWLFSEEKLSKNIELTTQLIARLLREFPDITFDVVSNREIDRDFAYMVCAHNFIRDQGGFSDLICDLRGYRDSRLLPVSRSKETR